MSQPQDVHPAPDRSNEIESLRAQIEDLKVRLARNEKIKQILMDRVERSLETAGNAYTLFERSILLEQSVSQRTAELKESETAYKTLFEQSPFVVILNKLSGEYIDVNEKFCVFSGLTREQVLGKTPAELGLLTEEQIHIINRELERNKGSLDNLEVTRCLPNGKKSTELLSSRIIEFHGDPVVLSILQNITESKQAQEALRESEARRRVLIETTATGYLILDQQGKVIDANSEYVRLTGSHRLEEIRGRSVLEWTAEYDQKKNAEAIAQCLRDRYIRNFEVDYVDPRGKITPVEINATVEGEGDALLILTLCRDITDRRQALEQIRLNEQRLATLFQLNQMADEPLNVLCQFAMEEAIRLTGSTIGYLAFVSEDETVLTMHAWSRSAMQECRIEDKPIVYPVDKTGLWGEAIRQRKPVITNDYARPNPLKKGCPQGHVSVRRHMNAPIFDGDRIVIVAGVGNKAADYDQTDVRQLTLLMQGMWGILRRKQAEEALRKSEQRYRTIVDHINDALYIHDFDGVLLEINDNTCKLLGYSREELIGSHLSRFDGPANVRRISQHMKVLMDTGRLEFDGEHVRKDGTLVPTTVSARVVSREGRGIAQSFIRDITERKRAEENQRIERQRLASIIEGTHVGTWEWNIQTGETVFNERWAEIVGYKLSELGPTNIQTWMGLTHPSDLKESESILQRHFAGELECYDCESRMRHKNGSWVWVHDRGKLLERTPDGKPLRMFGTHSDITDRKRTEENLRTAMEAANAASGAKSQFLANMSHEIRTPMNAILGFADILAQDTLTPQQSDYVQTIRNSGTHLLDLINDILDFSKIEAGKMTLDYTDCMVSDMLNEIKSLMAPFAQSKKLRLEWIEPEGLPQTIRTDQVRLRQCLVNLVNNAIKFTEAGFVRVRTTQTESENHKFLRFEVKDSGPGIEESVRKRIFEAFEQADGSMTRKYGGTGLGLTITRHLAELMGGRLSVNSRVGKGSTFILEIPALNATENPPSQTPCKSPISAEPGNLPRQFQGRVLVAEDVKTNQVLVRILLNQVGLEPVIVEDGQAAIEQAMRHDFDLILLDMQMPRLNGFEAALKLRKQGIQTPIVALTAAAIKGDEDKCRQAGCDEYLTKPIDRKALIRTLTRFLPAVESLHRPA